MGNYEGQAVKQGQGAAEFMSFDVIHVEETKMSIESRLSGVTGRGRGHGESWHLNPDSGHNPPSH